MTRKNPSIRAAAYNSPITQAGHASHQFHGCLRCLSSASELLEAFLRLDRERKRVQRATHRLFNQGSAERAEVAVLRRAAWHSQTEAWDKERLVVLLHSTSNVQLSSRPRVMSTSVETATLCSVHYEIKNVLSHVELGNQGRSG